VRANSEKEEKTMKATTFVEYFPPKLGSDRRIFEIMRRLSRKHELQFIVVPPFRMLSGDLPLTRELFRHFQKRRTVVSCNGIIGHYISIEYITHRLWQSSYILAYILTLVLLFREVIKTVKRINPQVVVLNYPSVSTGILGLVVGKILRKSVVLDFNDLIAQYTACLLELERSSLKAKVLAFFQDLIVKNCDKIVAVTNFVKNYSLALGVDRRKIVVIPNGVDTELFNPNNYDRDRVRSELNLGNNKVCLYCGRLDDWAGLNIIKNLCKVSQKKCPDVKFVIVGGELGIFDNLEVVVAVGEVPHEEVPRIMVAADVVLVPFPENAVSHAASPLKLFEGMAMEKPVIASKVHGIAEIVTNGENGMLVDPSNIDEWLQVVSYVLNSKSIATKIGKRARGTVEARYEWNTLAKQYEEVLLKTISMFT